MLQKKRVAASRAMGFPFYRGQDWFIRNAMEWLPKYFPAFNLRRAGNCWQAKVAGERGYYTSGPCVTVEEALVNVIIESQK